MKLVATLILALALSASPCTGQAGPSDPLEFYRGYLVVLAKATSLDALLPYYTKDLATALGKMPKEMQGNYLKMNSRTLTDLEVTRKSVEADKAEFEMTAKTGDGNPTTGSATLVREDGDWKLENESWIAQAPE